MSLPLQRHQDQLSAVIKTAQYLAGLDSDRNIWAELGGVAIHFLGADLAGFVTRRSDDTLMLHHCIAPDAACGQLVGTASGVIQQVLDSGFLAAEQMVLGAEYAIAFLPLRREPPTPVVMAVGHRMGDPLSRDALNLYLAVAGLFQSTLTRLSSQHRFMAMADNVPEMLFQLTSYPDGKMQFSYVSGGSRTALGIAPEQLQRDATVFSSALPPKDRAEFETAIARGARRLHRIVRHHDADGHERHLLVNAVPRQQEDGSIQWDGALQDVTEHERLELERKEQLRRLEKSMEATVEVMASTIEMRDPYTAGHQRRVGELALHIAREMHLPAEQAHGISIAGRIHDIGKIYVPAEILSFPGKLGKMEYELVKAHAQVGYDILKVVDFPWPVAEMVLEHHERMDGSGYPRGLTGEAILLGARIISVADVVESIASFRPYRPALGLDYALAEIAENRGRLYDPEVVDACLLLFREKGYRLPE